MATLEYFENLLNSLETFCKIEHIRSTDLPLKIYKAILAIYKKEEYSSHDNVISEELLIDRNEIIKIVWKNDIVFKNIKPENIPFNKSFSLLNKILSAHWYWINQSANENGDMRFGLLKGKDYTCFHDHAFAPDDAKKCFDNIQRHKGVKNISRLKRVSEVEKLNILNQDILKGFSPEFLDHPDTVTWLQDYFSFLSNRFDWLSGNGLFRCVTHKEMGILWNDVSVYGAYEAYLLRFINSGGHMIRYFVLPSKFISQEWHKIFLRVLYRHYMLKLNPQIISVLDIRNIDSILDVHCETFGILNNQFGYYFQFPDNTSPYLVSTTRKKFLNRINKCLDIMSSKSESFDKWYKRHAIKLNSDETKKIEEECLFIHDLADVHT